LLSGLFVFFISSYVALVNQNDRHWNRDRPPAHPPVSEPQTLANFGRDNQHRLPVISIGRPCGFSDRRGLSSFFSNVLQKLVISGQIRGTTEQEY
jgi:hypothetical protein